MKKIILLFLGMWALAASAQTVGKFRYDTTKFYKVGGFNEVKILNSTMDSVGGVFTNVGGGWGKWIMPTGGGGGSTNPCPRPLLSGGIVTPSNLMTLDVTTAVLCISNNQYTALADSVVLDAADLSLPRQDLIVADTFGLIYSISGIPNADPAEPSYDASYQVPLTSIFITAGATTPTGVSSVTLWDENIGVPEWTASATGLTVDFNSTTTPYHLTKTGDVGAWTSGDRVSYIGAPYNNINYNTLKFFLKLKSTVANNANITVTLLNSLGQAITQTLTLSNLQGFSKTIVGEYQNISIPLAAFSYSVVESETIGVQIGGLRIGFIGTNANGLYIDYITLTGGIQTPVEPSNPWGKVYRKTATDSVFQMYNGVPVYAFKDSTGGGGAGAYIPLSGTEVGSPVTGTITSEQGFEAVHYDFRNTGNPASLIKVYNTDDGGIGIRQETDNYRATQMPTVLEMREVPTSKTTSTTAIAYSTSNGPGLEQISMSADTAAKGISSNHYYTNKDLFTYVQKHDLDLYADSLRNELADSMYAIAAPNVAQIYETSDAPYTTAFDYTPAVDYTVGADSMAFVSAALVSRRLKLKKDGIIYYHNHERWEINANVTFNDLANNDAGLFIGTESTFSAGALQGFQVKAHPANGNLLFIYFVSNGSPLTNIGNLTFVNGDDIHIKITRDRNNFTIVLKNQKDATFLTHSEKIGPNLAVAYGAPGKNSMFIYEARQGDFVLRDIEFTHQDARSDLLFVGNSITSGSQTTGYYKSFGSIVRDKFLNTTIHAGPGSLTSDVVQELPAIVYSSPKKVLLMIGSNDLGTGVLTATIQANFTTIVNTLTTAGIEVVLLSVLPRDDVDARPLNTWMQSAFPTLQYIDLFPLLADAGTYTANGTYYNVDQVHPNNAGHSLIADKILDVLNNPPKMFQNVIIPANVQVDGTLNANRIKVAPTYMGTATLVAGTVTVVAPNVNATSIIMLSRKTIGGTIGELYQPTITNNTSFVITSTSNLDTGTVNWWILDKQ